MNGENPIAVLLRRLLCGWLAAVTLEYLLLPAQARGLEGLAALQAASFLRVLLTTLLVAALLYLPVLRRWNGAARRAAPALFGLYAVLTLRDSFSWALLGGCVLLFGLLTVYALRGWDASPAPVVSAPVRAKPVWAWLTALLALLFFAFVGAWGLARVRSFSSPSYDFGIFSQMFASMRRSGTMLTTLERRIPLSHLKVHVSPIFYLLLPFYCLVPRPETLQLLQAAVMASAALPLWKLGGLHGLTGPRRFLLCALLLAAPVFGGGAGFDLHENCFLTPLLLWLLWALDADRRPAVLLTALLTLCVKEDAGLYLAVVGLWAALRALLRPERRSQLYLSLLLVSGAMAWFGLAGWWLSRYGDGVMLYRYGNLLYEGGSIFALPKALLMLPMKALYECLRTENLSYIALSLGAMLALPLWTRRWEDLLLLLPWLIVNLLSPYVYQHNIFYQYSFGSVACLIYLACAALRARSADEGRKGAAERRRLRLRPAALAAAVLLSAGCFVHELLPEASRFFERCRTNAEGFAQIRAVLDRLPDEAAVTASTFYTVPLSDRERLYDMDYVTTEQLLSSDWVLVSAAQSYESFASPEAEDPLSDGRARFLALMAENGFRQTDGIPGVLTVYGRAERP